MEKSGSYKQGQSQGYNIVRMALLIVLFLNLVLISGDAIASPPVRQNTYVSDQLISSNDVSANEDVIFNYLQAGVDTYKDNTIVNDDIAASANIQSDKLNLGSIGQLLALSSAGIRPAKVTSDPCGDTTLYPEGSIFYNDTSNYMCFCNGSGADKKISNESTDCF